jgi:hypothetical protein
MVWLGSLNIGMIMVSSILPFTSALSGASTNSYFMAVNTDAPDGGDFMEITPRVMQWDTDTYILDLAPVTQYWTHIANEHNLSLTEFLSARLDSLTHPSKNIAIADHPWRALLALSVMSKRNSIKFLDVQSHLGRKILHDATWNEWLELCRKLRDRLADGQSKTAPVSFSSINKTIERMHMTHIAQMADVESTAMQRRFGRLIAKAWDWTWIKNKSTLDEHLIDAFPWQSFITKETPTINRYLEPSLRNWEHIAPLLCEDFDKICNLNCWTSSERVVSLEWVLSFSCSPSLSIPVLFRHPHALHRETGHHKTALLQAFYSWSNAQKSRQKHPTEGETYITDDAITEWTIRLTERLVIPPSTRSLFKDEICTENTKLRDLENSLPIPLISYSPTDHWTPERSYEETQDHHVNELLNVPSGYLARLIMNQRRPLFIFEHPEPIVSKAQSSGMIFCERLATSWWTDTSLSTRGVCRNYYVRMTDDGLLQWVFQNDDGSLCLHGIYG